MTIENVPLFDQKPYTVERPPSDPRCYWCGRFLPRDASVEMNPDLKPLCVTCQVDKDDAERPRGAVPGEYRPLSQQERSTGKRGVQAARAALRGERG